MKRSFLHQSRPVVTALFRGQTPQQLIAAARTAEFDGADALAVELSDLKPEFRNTEALRSVTDAVHLPFMFIFYRNDNWAASSDAERQKLLLKAVDAGAAMIDVMGDLYDPSPMEITRNARAIDRQKRLIGKIHAKGAEVVISSHMSCPRNGEQVLEHLTELAKRGADAVKIVHTADTPEELAEAFRTTMLLKQELKMPFIHLCNGKFSRPHRFLGPALGVSIIFTATGYTENALMTQPTVRATRSVLDNLNWHISNVL